MQALCMTVMRALPLLRLPDVCAHTDDIISMILV